MFQRNLNKHLIQKLDKLKIEQNAVRRECLSNEELGDTISEKVLRFVTPREASKYKSYVKEIGQITSLLLGLGERLAKVENSLFDMPSDSYCNEKVRKRKAKKKSVQLICTIQYLRGYVYCSGALIRSSGS